MVLIELAQTCFIVIMSSKLTKQARAAASRLTAHTTQLLHHTASDSFLIQSYLSTVLLFAGTYTLLFRVRAAGRAALL